MASVRYEAASRIYSKDAKPAVNRLDLQIEDGEFVVLVGPSGSGKTTALRMLAGLEPTDEGRILIEDRDVTHVVPQDRDIAMVFQNYALYPQKTVADNMAFALKMQGMPKEERYRRVRETAAMLGLEDLLDRKPKALSGGQRQRVAMGRAIVREPRVFLMDEPLSNLDAKLRVQTRSQIAELQRRIGVTTVYVTHDQVEAMTMGTRVAVLHNGELQQCASPRTLYDDPANLFVAGFIGSPAMNLVTVGSDGRTARLGGRAIDLPSHLAGATGSDGRVVLGIRPEHLQIGSGGGSRAVGGEVVLVEELGADSFVHVRIDDQDRPLVVRAGGRNPPRPGEQVSVSIGVDDMFAFDPGSGIRLGVATPSAGGLHGQAPLVGQSIEED